MNDTKEDKLIAKTYYNLSKGSAFFGPKKIHEFLKKKNSKHAPSIYKIRKWLERNDNYTLQKPVRRKFRRGRVLVSEPYEQYDADLADLSSLADENDKYRYILVVIDIFTRYVWLEPLRTKRGKDVLNAFKAIFSRGFIPKKIRSDGGAEFKFKELRDFFKANNVYHHISLNTAVKANYSERVILTLKRIMYRMFNKQRSYRYLDKLQNIANSYNATPHRSLNYTAPKDVNQSNAADLWAHMYLKSDKVRDNLSTRRHKQHYKYKIGDLVRISHLKRPFLRAYDQQWSSEIFKIYQRFLIEGLPVYRIEDFLDKKISGNFYSAELQKVFKDENSLWYIEKTLRKRTYRGRKQHFVKFEGWDDRFNCWIDVKDIQE